MGNMSQADEIREYMFVAIVKPARRRGEKTVTVRASQVARGMGLESRYPNICQALDGAIFAEYADVKLLHSEGKPQSSAVTWTFEV